MIAHRKHINMRIASIVNLFLGNVGNYIIFWIHSENGYVNSQIVGSRFMKIIKKMKFKPQQMCIIFDLSGETEPQIHYPNNAKVSELKLALMSKEEMKKTLLEKQSVILIDKSGKKQTVSLAHAFKLIKLSAKRQISDWEELNTRWENIRKHVLRKFQGMTAKGVFMATRFNTVTRPHPDNVEVIDFLASMPPRLYTQ